MFKSAKTHLVLLFIAFVYGATYSIAKLVMPALINSSAFIYVRVLVAGLLFLIVHQIFIKEKLKERKHFWQLGLASLFGVAGNMLMFFKGLSLTSPVNASVLMLNTPVFVLLFTAFFLKQKVGIKQWVGILVAGIGAVLLILNNSGALVKGNTNGDLWIIGNAISYAAYLVYVHKLLKIYHPFTVVKYTFLWGMILIAPFGIPPLLQTDFSMFTSEAWGALAFVCLGTTFLAYLLNAWAIQKASPTLVGAYIYLQPVIATLIAILNNQDKLSFEKVTFALMIFVGVFLSAQKKNSSKKA